MKDFIDDSKRPVGDIFKLCRVTLEIFIEVVITEKIDTIEVAVPAMMKNRASVTLKHERGMWG